LYQAQKGSRWILLKRRRELKPQEEASPHVILNVSEELRIIYLLEVVCTLLASQAVAGPRLNTAQSPR